MTEEFLENIKREYMYWRNLKNIESTNLINYNENTKGKRVSLEDFLKEQHLFLSYIGMKYKSTEDKYPIYCYLKSEKTDTIKRITKKMSRYADLYWDLQTPGYSFSPSDFFSFGTNRERFRIENENNIIYPLDGQSFIEDNTILKIQAEFIEEALRTNQEDAKKLILQRYERK